MKIVKKYYGSTLRLRKMDKYRKNEPILRMKVLNGKEFPCCDFEGICTNKAYAEVFPGALKKGKGWCYLCKRHYYEEERTKLIAQQSFRSEIDRVMDTLIKDKDVIALLTQKIREVKI